jgi:hypothetical protein
LLDAREFDQVVVQEKKFSIDEMILIIKELVVGDLKFCSIYDFIYSLEVIYKQKNIEFVESDLVDLSIIAGVGNNMVGTTLNNGNIDNLNNNPITNQSTNNLHEHFFEAWDHFLKFRSLPSKFKFIKIDCLVECSDSFIEVFLDYLGLGIECRNILFLKFLNRILNLLMKICVLSTIGNKFGNGKIVNKNNANNSKTNYLKPLVETLSPLEVPYFNVFFIQNCEFNLKNSLTVLRCLNSNSKLYSVALSYFLRGNNEHYAICCYAVSPKYPFFKNLFMCNVSSINKIGDCDNRLNSNLTITLKLEILLRVGGVRLN